ncbi:DUF4437 domain-containing protein [Stieleria sedimenti]|uniref:DUF4437 domain-containing protein n=1 Tax=Stieleria sedimenti TaxID=2976331 RepID=UPI003899EEF1
MASWKLTPLFKTDSPSLRVVVIKGQTRLHLDEGGEAKPLPSGSCFGSHGPASHRLSCDDECILYVRTQGKFTLSP